MRFEFFFKEGKIAATDVRTVKLKMPWIHVCSSGRVKIKLFQRVWISGCLDGNDYCGDGRKLSTKRMSCLLSWRKTDWPTDWLTDPSRFHICWTSALTQTSPMRYVVGSARWRPGRVPVIIDKTSITDKSILVVASRRVLSAVGLE